jgi:hypothetical protein
MDSGQHLSDNSDYQPEFDRKYQPEDTFWFHLRMLTMHDLMEKKKALFLNYHEGNPHSIN